MGAGHDGAATELTRHLTAAGFLVDRHDFLDLLPLGLGKLLCGAYLRLLTWAPGGYQRIYAATEHERRPNPAVRSLLRGAERRTLAAVTPGTRAVVSTYPGASQVLGALRLSGRLAIPALTYLTDFSVHSLWVAPGIDAHLAAHAIPAAQAHEQGAAGVTVTGPMTDPRFTPADENERRAARTRFGLPQDTPLALLVAGSWGVGPVREAAAEILDTGVALPVVVCGRNHALAERLRADGIAHVHGWVDDMPGLMHACDVLVQNAGGLTSLEALAGGLPVVSYRCIPGHGQTNAAALDEAGLAPWIREPHQLAPTLVELLHGPRGQAQRAAGLALYASAPGPVPAVTAMTRRPLSAARPSGPATPVESPTAAGIPPQRRRRVDVRRTTPGRRADDVRPVMPGPPGTVRPGTPDRRAFARFGLPARQGHPTALLADALTAAPSDALTAVPTEALRLPVAARFAAKPRQARRRTALMVAAVAATLSLGIGAPLAYAYGESPGHHFGALTHYLEDDDR
ncbi:glycosyltransferase [Streptomyces sp. NBC_01136]|uniref:glycosyltransferase n=1 Tax=unclassified Streptomyces TaxID=2593676 RepID=UPI00324CCCD2|nr:glycosyltransferase [Streptomyces sp. NBC_01136]